MSKFIDRTGQTFGRLTVIERAENTRKGNARFRCECACGAIVTVTAYSLSRGVTKSCGCWNKEQASASLSKTRKSMGLNPKSPRNKVLSAYLYSAKDKGLSFHLSGKEFDDLIFSRCFYCDAEPFAKASSTGQFVRYNGIDRLDNSVGYIKENCVPCCKICNMMKRSMSLNDFVRQCQKITETIGLDTVNNTVYNRLEVRKGDLQH